MVSFNKVNEILKTLPVGFYLGGPIECALENSDRSYYDPMDYKIHIGYALIPLDKLDESDPEIEDNIRCMLYHEISHVLLTPTGTAAHPWLNVFEDQRIETVLRDYFHRVDFKSFVKKVNDFHGEAPKSDFEYYYQIIRYGIGPKCYIDRRNKIILKYAKLSARFNYDWYDYVAEVKALYNDIVKAFDEKASASESTDSESTSESGDSESDCKGNSSGAGKSGSKSDSKSDDKSGESSASDKSSMDGDKAPKAGESKAGKPGESPCHGDKESRGEAISEDADIEIPKDIKDEIKSIITKELFPYKDDNMKSEIKAIFDNAERKRRNRASAISAYSGKLNVKRIDRPGKIETYKWWDKVNSHGDQNRFDNVQLNLFCDVSGSFSRSEKTINKFINCLIELEKSNRNFKFKLVKMGDKNTLAKDNERRVNCQEGNHLTNDILDIYKMIQTPNTTVYNIAVFDGDAQSFDGISSYRDREKARAENVKAWSAWNHPNCIIISDYDNASAFDKGSPNAKRIYTHDYTGELKANIIKALNLLVR